MRQQVVCLSSGARLMLALDYRLPGGVLGEVVDRLVARRRTEREVEHTHW